MQTLVGGPLAAFTVAIGWALWAFGGSAAATLTTGTIIGSAPPERAGAVSALAQDRRGTGRRAGHRRARQPRDGDLSRDGDDRAASGPEARPAAAAARDTLGGALNVASQLSDPAAATALTLTAQQALTNAVQVTCALSAVVSILTAVAVALYFNARGEPSRSASEVDRREQEPALAA